MSSPSAPLRVEALETRDVPATFGTPWPDGQNVTLSFAPDGTPISGTPSDLAAALANLGPAARLEVLRAFQAWAVHANVNIGLVADSGARFGTGGATQGDPRFGDVRVGGRALPGDVLAVTAPYNLYDNYSGDIVLNTATDFGPGGYDLYTALLQEAGHALGVGNSASRDSAMYEWYSGARTGLSATDIVSIQSLYGTRAADQYEGAGGNNTLATATRFPLLTRPLTADLTAAGDADVYKFTAGLLTNKVTVSLKASGLSLLTARVELLDSGGRVVATGAATDPTSNDVTVSFSGTRAGQTYYIRVSGARADDFAIGSYELDLKQSSLLTAVTDIIGGLLDDTGLNDTLFTATNLLLGGAAVGPQTEYGVSGSFGTSRDVDVYRVVVPPGQSSGPTNLLVTIYGQNGRQLDAWLEVTDAVGRKLDAEVITADGGTTTLQVRGLTPGAAYFIRAKSDAGAVGGYRLAADLRTDVETVPQLAAGDVSGTAAQIAPLELSQSAQVHFVLAATGGAAEAVVTDASGAAVGHFQTNAGRGRSLDLFLPAGTYTVSVRAIGGAAVGFRLGAAIVTDPIGAKPEDPTNAPQPSAPPAPAPDQPVSNPQPAPTQPSDGALPPEDEPEPTDPPQAAPPPQEPPAEGNQQASGELQPQPTGGTTYQVTSPTSTTTTNDEYAWWY